MASQSQIGPGISESSSIGLTNSTLMFVGDFEGGIETGRNRHRSDFQHQYVEWRGFVPLILGDGLG